MTTNDKNWVLLIQNLSFVVIWPIFNFVWRLLLRNLNYAPITPAQKKWPTPTFLTNAYFGTFLQRKDCFCGVFSENTAILLFHFRYFKWLPIILSWLTFDFSSKLSLSMSKSAIDWTRLMNEFNSDGNFVNINCNILPCQHYKVIIIHLMNYQWQLLIIVFAQ